MQCGFSQFTEHHQIPACRHVRHVLTSSLNGHPPGMWENAFLRCSHSDCEDGAWEEWPARAQDQKTLAVKSLKRFLVLPQWHPFATEPAGLVSLLRLLCQRNHIQKAPPLVSRCNTMVLLFFSCIIPAAKLFNACLLEGGKSENQRASAALLLETFAGQWNIDISIP